MLISIIVPVYNTEKYLDECIQSILNQTYSNFELLLINDGSTDRSGEICDANALKDERIKVFHQQNAGVSAARNLGLDHAKGEWVTFVDSDDYIGQNYLFYQNSEFDLILCNAVRFNKNSEHSFLKFNDFELSKNEFFEQFSLYPHFPGPCAKFYIREIIQNNKIRFDNNLHFGEDALFNITYLQFVNRIKSIPTKYYYRDTEDSLSKKTFNYKHDLYLYEEIKLVLGQYKNQEILALNIQYPLNRLLLAIYNDCNISEEDRKSKLKKIISEEYDYIIFLFRKSIIRFLISFSYRINSYSFMDKYFKRKLYKC